MSIGQVKFGAQSHVVALEVGTGLTLLNRERITLRDQSGLFQLTCPKVMFPFAEVGDTVILSVTVVKAEVQETSPIIMPNEVN